MAERLSDFMNDVQNLKRLDRAGWVNRGIQNPESVAEHSFGTGWLAFALAPRFGLDPIRSAMLGFVHDMGESRIGDKTPADNISPEQKFAMEESAMREITSAIPHGEQMMALWYEVERGETPEGRFVRKIDKLEMMFQAREYGVEQPDVNLEEFWDYGDKFNFEEMEEVYRHLKDSK